MAVFALEGFSKKQYYGFEAKTLRVLIDFNGPDHPFLTPPFTSAPEPYFISYKGQHSWLRYGVGVPVFASWIKLGLVLWPCCQSCLQSYFLPIFSEELVSFETKSFSRGRGLGGGTRNLLLVTDSGCETDEQCQEFKKVKTTLLRPGTSALFVGPSVCVSWCRDLQQIFRGKHTTKPTSL